MSIISRVNGLFDNNLTNNCENKVWNLEHNAKMLQEVLMQGIMSIIISAPYNNSIMAYKD